MFVFPLYAAIVWYACYRYRRRFLGYAAYAAGVLGIVLLLWVDVRLTRWVFNQPAAPSLLLMLSAEAGLVGLVGAFIVFSPRHRAVLPCRDCGYELDGLDEPNPTCPECGLAYAARKVRPGRCVDCGGAMAAPADGARCPGCHAAGLPVPSAA